MQLTTVGREIWRGAKKAEALIEAEVNNPTVQHRLRKLKQVEAFRKHGVALRASSFLCQSLCHGVPRVEKGIDFLSDVSKTQQLPVPSPLPPFSL